MSLELIHRLFDHAAWADAELRRALVAAESPPADALREYAHVLGADEVWLARLEGRAAELKVWPEVAVAEYAAWGARIADGYRAYLARIDEGELTRVVSYTTSSGMALDTAVADILAHVALHAQYHRGKINLLLRQSGGEPAPTDYIAFARGVPAARTAVPGHVGAPTAAAMR